MRSSIRAIVLSGGRMPRQLASHYSFKVKSLIPYQGKTLLARGIEAALGIAGLAPPVAVVGPPDIKEEVQRFGERACWLLEGDTLMDNVTRGAQFFGWENAFLLVSPDLPLVTSDDLGRFLNAVPKDAEMCVPVVRKEDFEAAFPECPNRFNRTREGLITMGSVFYSTGRVLKMNVPLARDAFRARKYPWRLAYMLGLSIIVKYFLGTVSIAEVERRASQLLDCTASGVIVPLPHLAYDIDNELNLRYLQEQTKSNSST